MTRREAAIVSAYTGILIGGFEDLHKYIESKFERPVFTHELASDDFGTQLRELSRDDFINIDVCGSDDRIGI